MTIRRYVPLTGNSLSVVSPTLWDLPDKSSLPLPGSPQRLEDSSYALCPNRSFLTQAKYPVFLLDLSSCAVIPSLSGSAPPAMCFHSPVDLSFIALIAAANFHFVCVMTALSLPFAYTPPKGRDRVCWLIIMAPCAVVTHGGNPSSVIFWSLRERPSTGN